MIDLSIIIINYNVKEFLLNLLDSIRKAVKNISTEIIIVDNASDDGSVEILREKFPNIKLIANKKNVGFGSQTIKQWNLQKGNIFCLSIPMQLLEKILY